MEDPEALIAGCNFLQLILYVLMAVGLWKLFEKAGQPAWAAIVPILNFVVLLKIVGRPWWWIILGIIPLVNLIVWVIVSIDTAKSYGKGTGYGIGIAFLPFVFLPMLGFSDAQYQYEPDPIF